MDTYTLGIDPSLTATGVALLEHQNNGNICVEWTTTIDTEIKTDYSERLFQITKGLVSLSRYFTFRELERLYVNIEEPIGKAMMSSTKQHAAFGAACVGAKLLLEKIDYKLEHTFNMVNNRSWKGYLNLPMTVKKKESYRYIQSMFPDHKFGNHNETDAVGVALYSKSFS